MNSSGGAATQVCAHKFDQRFYALPKEIQNRRDVYKKSFN